MINIQLPFWLNATENSRLIGAAQTWWVRVEGWMLWPIQQFDALHCSLSILSLLAWQRDIKRFNNEPETLFRLRVKYALINAQEAGSKAGFASIFKRLDIELLLQRERWNAINWDVIQLLFPEAELSGKEDIFNFIVRQYGRTCRRYEFVTVDNVPPILLETAEFNLDQATHVVSIAEVALNDVISGMAIAPFDFNLNQATDVVELTL